MKKSILLILLAVWMAFIFSMSSQDSTESSDTSGETIRFILSIVPQFNEKSEETKDEIVESLQHITRKSAHFLGYMLLGILTILLFLEFEKLQYKPQWAFLFCVLYAISDEIHQLFVPGRSGQIRDVFIDSCGSFLGIVVIMCFVKLKNFNKVFKHL